jgi:hypothetical protein
MQYVTDGIAQVASSNGFANAFWILVGIMVGALIQFMFHVLVERRQRNNALAVLSVEIEMNLTELQSFREWLRYLRERIAANQITPENIFISMKGFDYSALGPLVSSGHFHYQLGPQGTRSYINFVRFFSNDNADLINSKLQTEHAAGRSLDFIQALDNHAVNLGLAYAALKMESKLTK